MSIQILCPFFNWIGGGGLLLSCMSSLQILDISPLSDKWFANIFSHSVGCLFILFPLLCRSFLAWHSPNCLFTNFLTFQAIAYYRSLLPQPPENKTHCILPSLGFALFWTRRTWAARRSCTSAWASTVNLFSGESRAHFWDVMRLLKRWWTHSWRGK